MRMICCAAAVAAMAFAAGCGGGSRSSGTGASAITGPHGGFAAPLPDGQGYAEVVIESEATSNQAVSDQRIVVYFLGPDRTSALATLPTDVSFRLKFPDKEAAAILLSAQPKDGSPAGSARFASAPGAYNLDEPIGELTAAIGGRTFTAPFSSVR